MPYFNHDQINFHYLERLQGGACPITFVFQHGLGGDAGNSAGARFAARMSAARQLNQPVELPAVEDA